VRRAGHFPQRELKPVKTDKKRALSARFFIVQFVFIASIWQINMNNPRQM